MIDIGKYSKDYSSAPFEAKRVELRRLVVLEQINQYPHDNILEVGCGESPMFLHFSDYQKMVVVEPSDIFYENAEVLASDKPNVVCVHGFLQDCMESLMHINFNFIIISSLLHEVESPEDILQSVKKLCSKETVVHINVPNANSFHRLIGKEMSIIKSEFDFTQSNLIMQQHSVFSKESLRKLLESFGFSIIEERTNFIKILSHTQMQKCLDLEIFDNDYLIGLSSMEKYLPDMGSEIYILCRVE